jgi:hypothetical protein
MLAETAHFGGDLIRCPVGLGSHAASALFLTQAQTVRHY